MNSWYEMEFGRAPQSAEEMEMMAGWAREREQKRLDREQYEKDLAEKQKQHLDAVRRGQRGSPWRPCLHDGCSRCHGTGIQIDGTTCVHCLSCPCPKCTPRF